MSGIERSDGAPSGLTESWEQWGWLHIRGHSIEDESVLGTVYGVNVATGARYSEHVNALHDLLRADTVQLRDSLVVVGSDEEFARTDRECNESFRATEPINCERPIRYQKRMRTGNSYHRPPRFVYVLAKSFIVERLNN